MVNLALAFVLCIFNVPLSWPLYVWCASLYLLNLFCKHGFIGFALDTIYRVFHLKCSPATHAPLHVQNYRANRNNEFLQLHLIVAADVLLETGLAVVSAVMLPDERQSQTNTSCVLTFCYQLVYCLSSYFLVMILIAECFTDSIRQFQCAVTFENDHIFC